MGDRDPRAFRSRLAAILLFTALLYAPSYSHELVANNPLDDWMQLASLEGAPVTMAKPFDLWAFYSGKPAEMEVLRRRGDLSWAWPLDFRWSFWRPLASVLAVADHALFGEDMLGYHLHCTAWWLLLVTLVGLFLRALLDERLALLATLAFAVAPAAPDAVCWIPARHMVVATCLALAGVYAHVRWRQGAPRWTRLLGLGAIALALTASEAAVQALAYLFAFEVWGARARPSDRVRALVPAAAIVVVYLCGYVLGGSGVRRAEHMGYHNPFEHPLETLANAGQLVPALCFELFSTIPFSTETERFPGMWLGGTAVLGGIFLMMLRACARRITAEERHALRWLLGGSALSLVPALGSQAGSRMLIVPLIGVVAAFAVIARHGWSLLREATGARRVLIGAGWVVAALPHLVFAPLTLVGAILVAKRDNAADRAERMRNAERLERKLAPGTAAVMLFNAPFGPVDARALPRPGRANRRWWPLPGLRDVMRTSADTLEGYLPDRPAARANFWPRRYPGEVIPVDAFEVRILEVNDDGRPLRFQLRFPGPLEEPSRAFFVFTDEGDWRRVEFAPIGTRFKIW